MAGTGGAFAISGDFAVVGHIYKRTYGGLRKGMTPFRVVAIRTPVLKKRQGISFMKDGVITDGSRAIGRSTGGIIKGSRF